MYLVTDQDTGEYAGEFDGHTVQSVDLDDAQKFACREDAQAFIEELQKAKVMWARNLTIIPYNADSFEERFNKFDDDFIKFEDIAPQNRLHNRRDMNAFLLLDKLVPGNGKMIAGADHDVIYLATDPEELNKVASDEQIRDLVRCGVCYNNSGFEMFC